MVSELPGGASTLGLSGSPASPLKPAMAVLLPPPPPRPVFPPAPVLLLVPGAPALSGPVLAVIQGWDSASMAEMRLD